MTVAELALEARPRIPEKLTRIHELAANLAYSWDREIRDVFWRLDRDLWNACGNNPKLFLRLVPQGVLDAAAADRDFMEDFHRALGSFDAYMERDVYPGVRANLDSAQDVIAYFCAEFGLHESLPIYSGGLGILAGDHCKAASDLGVPLVAVGLLYRQGYFIQTIDAAGQQEANARDTDFDEMPVRLCLGANGGEIRVELEIAERAVIARLWEALVGHVRLILLDTDVAENPPDLRAITHQLYGGNADTRIMQEMVLGIGGVRALRALGITPTVFHMNEGHAAFLVLERLREEIARGAEFETALELVAASNVFTTHTPVAAGHDVFPVAQLRPYLRSHLARLQCDERMALSLGAVEADSGQFNMTVLALKGSRHHNGVSKIHGEVASAMEAPLWPQIAPEDNPILSVTNGVHLHTFMARAWNQVFHDLLRGWRNRLLDDDYWQGIDSIPYERFVAVRRQLKRDLFIDVNMRLGRQLRRNGVSEAVISRATRHLTDVNSKMLVIGFARRFATYKRATLLLTDEARLARILNNLERPAMLIFAGKAHPRDRPGQELIRRLHETSMKPEFIGRIIVLEGYDMLLARNLVQGCDVWLNTPEYPMEASGTSGQKAGINGVVNVSVADGWWAEGYDGSNGFVIKPVETHTDGRSVDAETARRRDEAESRQLLDIIEDQVVPTYYGERNQCYAAEWVQISKNSMKSLIPRFNSARMVMDYVRGFYSPAAAQGRRFAREDRAVARHVAQWKSKVRARWGGVAASLAGMPRGVVMQDEVLDIAVEVRLNGLAREDVAVEYVATDWPRRAVHLVSRLEPLEDLPSGGVRYVGRITPLPGRQHYRLRVRPLHEALSHPFELGLQLWVEAGLKHP